MANSLQWQKQDLQSHQSQMLSQMQDMMTKLLSLAQSPPQPTTSNNNIQPKAKHNSPRCGHLSQGSHICQYCWLHSACVHRSNICHTCATGHQTTATFSSMMGSSTWDCYWLQPSWHQGQADDKGIEYFDIELHFYPMSASAIVPPTSQINQSQFGCNKHVHHLH